MILQTTIIHVYDFIRLCDNSNDIKNIHHGHNHSPDKT